MPNPWDVGSARYLQSLGFKALATTSAGFAWTLGKADGQVTLDEKLAHLRAIVGAVDVPINADFEGGFAVEPESVAANVRRAAETGVAGLSIEDSVRGRRRRRAAVRVRARGGAGARGTRGARRDGLGGRADRPLGGLHRRPARPRRDDPPPACLRRRGRRLPVRPRHLDPRADRRCRQGRRAQARQRAHLGRLPAAHRARRSWGSGA